MATISDALVRAGISAVLVCATLACISRAAPAQTRRNPRIPSIGSKNLLPNSSFELGADGWSSLGKPTAWGGDLCGLVGAIQAGDAFVGTHCLRIELAPGKTPVTHSDYTLAASKSVIQAAPLAANLGWIDVSVGQLYTLSAYMRADREDVPADLVFRFGGDVNSTFGSDTHTKRVSLSQEWARYSFSMTAEQPDVFVAVGPNLSDTPDASATVWIDAVQLEASPETAEASPAPTEYAPREPVEVGIDGGHYGNLFDVGESVGFSVYASNTTASSHTVEVQARLEDYFGELGPASLCCVKVPGKGRASAFLPLAAPGAGYYKAQVSWNAAGATHIRTIKMAVIDTYPWKDSPFGLNHFPTTAAACEQLKKAGVTWARDWSMKWESIEPRESTYDFTEIGRQVGRILDLGANLLPLLPPQPSSTWASEAPMGELTAVKRAAYAPAPEHRAQLNAFITATVERYKDRLDYWEFLNEPLWVPWYCLPTSAGYTVDTYLGLLKGASAAMKAADPTCHVIGGLSCMATSKLGEEFIQKGGLAHVDIYNLHPYPEGDAPESFIPSMQRILAVMDTYGGRKPIWATELSYWATDDKPWSPWAPPNPDHWAANRQQSSEREAADFNIREAVILLAHGVVKIFWHSGLEGELNNGSHDLENPLLDPEAIPQKFFAAQAALARLLGPAPSFAAALEKPETVSGHSTDDVHGYAFDTPSGAAMAVWAPGTLNDGRRSDEWTAPLGESPVYVTTRAMTALELSRACTLIRNADAWALEVPDCIVVQTIVGTPMLTEGQKPVQAGSESDR